MPEEVVVQPCLMVSVLVLQAKGLVSAIRYVRFALQFTPTVIISEPNQVTFAIGHLTRDSDLVAVEVVGLLSVFSAFVDVVLIGETVCVRTAHTLRKD